MKSVRKDEGKKYSSDLSAELCPPERSIRGVHTAQIYICDLALLCVCVCRRVNVCVIKRERE